MRILYCIVACLSLYSCSNCDFTIPKSHRALLDPYEVGDTIYFESDRGDIDTIFISKVDSVEECGILMTGKRKDIFYEIQHLPYNNWIFGKNLHRNGEISEINQSLIFLSKNLYEPSKDDYSIHIQYRNFSGELDFW